MTITYNGTTAGSTSANPPVLLAQAMSGQIPNAASGITGAKLWLYASSNASTDLIGTSAAPSISDGYALGMRAGDVIMLVGNSTVASTAILSFQLVIGTNTSSGAWCSSNVISSTAT